MAFKAIPNTARVDVRSSLFGQLLQSSLYFLAGEPITAAALDGLVGGIASWVTLELVSSFAESLQFREVFGQDMSEENGKVSVASFNNVTGVVEATSLPGSVCLVPSFRTGLAGRSFRGRVYLSGLPEASRSGNQWTESALAVVRATFDLLKGSTYVPVGWQWVVVSRYANKAERVTPICTPVVSVSSSDADIDSQRRRLSGRGQ